MADGSVVIEILGDDSKFQSAVKGIGNISGKAFKATATAIGGVATALSGVAAYAIKAGADFEASMSNVAAISGASASELDKLSAKAKEMGAKTKFSATESADALSYMAMAGWKTDDMLNGLEGIMNLAAASGEDLAATSDIVTDALTAFGMSASDSGRFADVLAAASSNANTNVSLMGETFKYVAPVAGALGYSVEDVSVAIGLMANQGIKGSQAGTALRGMLTNLAKPSDQVAGYMKALGLSLTDAAGKMKPMSELLTDIRKKFSGLTEAQKAEYAAGIAGQEGMSGLLAIVNSSDADFAKLTDAINNSSGAAENMAKIMNDNLPGAITMAKSALNTLAINVGESLQTPLKEAVQAATGMIQELQEAFNSGGINGLIEAAGGVFAELITRAAQEAPKMIDAAVAFIQSFLDGIQENLPQIVEGAISIIGSLASGIVELLPQIIEVGAQLLITLANSLAEKAPEMVPKIVEVIMDLVQYFAENADKIVEAGIQLIMALGEGLINSIPILIEKLPDVIIAICNVINDNAPKLLLAAAVLIKQLAVGLIQSIPTLIANIPKIIQAIVAVFTAFNWLNLGKTIITALKNGIAAMAGAVKTAATNILNAINNGLKALPSKLLALGRQGMQGLINGLRSLISGIAGVIKTVASSIVNGLKSLPSKLLTIGKQIIQGLINGIKTGISGVVSAIGSVIKAIPDTAKKLLGIHSPSRLMREQVGRMISLGIAIGIEDGKPAILGAMTLLSDAAYECAQQEATSYKEIGEIYAENLTYGVEALRDKSVQNMKDWVDADVAAYESQIDKQTDDVVAAKKKLMETASTAQKESLQKQIDQIEEDAKTQKEAYKAAAEEVTTAYKEALDDGYAEALNVVQNRITAITDAAQSQLESIQKSMDSMESKLADSDLFTEDKNKNIQLIDWDVENQKIRNYDEALTQLKNKGISDELMSQITGLGVEEGTKLAQKLNGLSESEFTRYISGWETQQKLAKETAEKFYADQLETLDDNFTSQLEEALESVPKSMTNIGQNAMQGMINGLYSESGALSSAARAIVEKAIRAMRDAADIHSPSKKTRDLVGKPMGQGVVVGAKTAMSNAMAEMQAAVNTEISRMSQQLTAASQPAPSNTVTREITNNNRTVEKTTKIEFTGPGAEFARALHPELKKEEKRVGKNLLEE